MGKFVKKKEKKKISAGKIVLLVVCCLVLALLIWFVTLMGRNNIPELDLSEDGVQATTGQESGLPGETGGNGAAPEQLPEPVPEQSVQLKELTILNIGDYTGVYMEDGSDEVLSGVMMIVLENNSEKDLQLARINIGYADFTAEFEVTNLPAGEKVVLLEKNRRSMPDKAYETVESSNVVFFEEKMSLMEEKFSVSGGNGYLELTNVTDEEIGGTVRIFYKNAASDLLYGGITYMASTQQPIDPGETIRILTGHYTAENSRILQITCGQ